MSVNTALNIGLNLEIGSIPVSLTATVTQSGTSTVYTFDGCVQNAVIDISSFMTAAAQQFGVSVQLPSELMLDALIDYVAGQITCTAPQSGYADTAMCMAAKFDLTCSKGGNTETVTLQFYASADNITAGSTDASPYVMGAAIDTNLAFSKLPLVGDIPVFNEFTLEHIGFSYTNATDGTPVAFPLPQVAATANPLYTRTTGNNKEKTNYSINTTGDQTVFTLDKSGFSLTAGLMRQGSNTVIDNFVLPLLLAAASSGKQKTALAATGPQTSPAGSPVHWININKTYGPVNLQKIGLNYQSGEATFGIDAGLAVGGFSLDVQGLSITFPMPLPGMPAGSAVSFDIEGLGMNFSEQGMEIGGAFLKTADAQTGTTSYLGDVQVQVGEYSFQAVGGYAPAQGNNPAAFFIYASLEAPLGGPPFLYVSGLAFGFGLNYSLILPTIDTLPTYLLLPDMAPPQGNAQNALNNVVGQLQSGNVIQYEPGEYWTGFGIRFTSFDMISAFALLTVSFGVDMQVGLLGNCAIVLPEGSPDPLASIQVNLVAAITPSTGLLDVTGVITPASYVLGPFVKLNGGFAYYLWFGGEHRGDFVLSVGGYHPAYNKPAWYPDVPRLRVTYNLGPFQASGSGYLALTPSMFMAGMSVAATFDASVVTVWFNLGADFLAGWAPFHYEADAYINVGCNIHLFLFTLHLHVGADLQLWGPSFGGRADVDLDVVSITIHFGSGSSVPVPITWQNLEQNFLPPPVAVKQTATRLQDTAAVRKPALRLGDTATTTANVTASVSAGLISNNITSQDGEQWNWVLDPEDFKIVTTTAIPANVGNWSTGSGTVAVVPNDPSAYNSTDIDTGSHPYYELPGSTTGTTVWDAAIHVKPMGLSNVQSVHTITLRKREDTDHSGQFSDYRNNVTLEPVLGNSNTALWGDPAGTGDVNIAPLLSNTLLGFTILPVPRNPDSVKSVPLIDLLFTAGEQTKFSNMAAQPDTAYTLQATEDAAQQTLNITVSGAASEVIDNSDYILSALTGSWVSSQRNTILDDLNNNGWDTYTSTEVSLTQMGSEEALTDWPMVAILSDNNVA